MPQPNWLEKLNEEQVVYADMVAQTAKKYGVPPNLALAVAKRESQFNPRAIGQAKEIGIMQVKPSTARDLGFTVGDMHDPAKNIEAGVKYLKENLDKFQSPELAALAYNRGPTAAERFVSGEENEPGTQYVQNINSLGGFSGRVEVEEPTGPADMAATKPTPEMAPSSDKSEQIARNLAGGIGAGLGGALGVARAGYPIVRGVPAKMGQMLASSVMLQAAKAMPQPGPLSPPPTGVQATGAPVPSAPRATGPGSAVVNYARAFGLPEIEAQRALDMTKQEGGVHALTTQRREGLREIAERFPGERYVENPRFGGLMTPDYGPSGPPQTFVQQPTGQITPLPKPAPIPTKPTGLEQVSQTFRGMMAPAGRLATRVLAPLGLFSTGAEGVAAAQELARPEPDYAAAAASGVGALGGVLSLFPPTAPIGVPLSLAGPMVREGLQQTRQRAIPPQQIQQMLSGPRQPDMSGMIRGLGR